MRNLAYFGLPIGAYLLWRDGHRLTTVVLSPGSAPGRRRLSRLVPKAHIILASEHSPQELSEHVDDRLHRCTPELVVSWYWTRLLPERWLKSAALGGVGVHPSLLPRHRGPDPFFWAIDCGDRWTGVTAHRLTATYDTGPILLQERLLIGDRNAWQLARALDRPGLRVLRRSVSAVLSGTAEERLQDEALATRAPTPSGEQLRVNFAWSTERVLRRLRALSPVPGVAIELFEHRLFLTEAHATSHFPRALIAGEAALYGQPLRLVFRSGDGAISAERALVIEPNGELMELQADKLAAAVVRWRDARVG